MRDEIAAAVVFLARVLREHHSLPKDKVADFSDSLSAILVERFKNHWYTEKPLKGQAYRCVRLSPNQHHDPVLKRAANQSDLELEYLNLPVELQLWIDPSEVTCRLGDHKCNQCLVASFKEGDIENNALTLDISCMLEKHQEDDAKNLTYLSCRSNKNYSSSYSKCYSPTEDWQEKGYYDTDKESLDPLWIEDYGDQYHYFLKDVRDKRMYLKQQHNSQNRYQQVFTTRHHYYNPAKQVSTSSTYTKSNYNPSSQHVQYNSSGTTYFRPIVKNRYQWVRGSNAIQTIAA